MALTVTSLVRVAGFHRWPEAPPQRAYLSNQHRHVFHVRATVRVTHEGRAVEFHDLAAHITHALNVNSTPYDPDPSLRFFGPASCEHIAALVAAHLLAQHYDVKQVSCSEDDEFTATWLGDPE